MIVGSAPSYAHGVVDPIADLAALAQENDLWMHTDACMGGFLLPYFRRLGERVPDFDFSVPGVTSISVDLHKYAYTPKGASLILYRNKALSQASDLCLFPLDRVYHRQQRRAEQPLRRTHGGSLGGAQLCG